MRKLAMDKNETIDRDNRYNKAIDKLKHCLKKKEYYEACKIIRYCAIYKYSLNDVMYDQEMEDALKEISDAYKVNADDKLNDTIFFYDQVSSDNRVLSMHYLMGLIEAKCKIVYIFFEENANNVRIREICNRENIKTVVLGKRYNKDAIGKLTDAYNQYKPNKVVSQNHVDDFVGTIFNYAIRNTNTRRYLINITDHAFWLGQGAYDDIIEFRDYGYAISKNERKLTEVKYWKLPYYAYESRGEFKGFDFEYKNKRIIFSGGGIYKTKGSDAFYEIIQHILRKFDDTVFLYLGDTADEYVYSKFEPELYPRIFVYKERDDLDHVMLHSHLYLNTYPIIGAVMSLYASLNNLPPFAICGERDPLNDIHDFYKGDCWQEFVANNKEGLIEKIDYYLEHDKEYQDLRIRVKAECVNKADFNKNLALLLNDNETEYNFSDITYDLKGVRDTYKSQMKDAYPKIAFASKSKYIFMLFKKDYIIGFMRSVKRHLKMKMSK